MAKEYKVKTEMTVLIYISTLGEQIGRKNLFKVKDGTGTTNGIT